MYVLPFEPPFLQKHVYVQVCARDKFIVLAANPFRRVISAAAWARRISGGRVIKPYGFDEAEQIAHFRAFVEGAAGPPVTPASKLLGRLPQGADPRVVRTNRLQEDWLAALAALGLPRSNFSRAHCVSSCLSTERNIRSYERGSAFDQRALYDNASAARVLDWYRDDFARFGFSPRVADMFS